MIALTMKGLANYMTASSYKQRTILRNFKYPKESESRAQAKYYREARRFIRAFLAGKYSVSWLDDKSRSLLASASNAPRAVSQRLKDNARAIQQYASSFADSHGRKIEVLKDVDIPLVMGQVTIKIRPDLHYEENGVRKLARFEFGSAEPKRIALRVLCQAMLEGATANQIALASSACSVFDIPRGKIHRLARVGSQTLRDIRAACDTIADIWPNISR